MKNKAQLDGMPVWFDGKSINEALFCEEFLQTHKIIFTNGAFFTPEGRVTDELPLRGEIFEELKCCAVSNIPRKISNIVELMKLAALAEDFPPEADRIHLSNGTLFLDGRFVEGKPEIVRNRFPVAYNPRASKPVLWLKFLDGLLYPEDIPTLQEYIGYSAEYLNLWMQAEDDTILEELYEDWEGTQGQSQYTMDFYRAIKETCPETIFHGTDVGHQYKTTGNRYLVWLNYKGMKDSDTYRQTLDSIEQGKTYYRDNDAVYRENQMVKNFAQAFDSLEGESVMGIYGAYHVSLEGDEQTPRMAAQLAEQYPGRVHTADVSELYAEDPVLEEITVGEKTYTASYWGEQDISGFSKKLVSRKFWRLEDGAEDFANCPTVDNVLPYDNYPVDVSTGQVFVLDYTAADGTVTRLFYRADGTFWNDRPITVQIDVSGLS